MMYTYENQLSQKEAMETAREHHLLSGDHGKDVEALILKSNRPRSLVQVLIVINQYSEIKNDDLVLLRSHMDGVPYVWGILNQLGKAGLFNQNNIKKVLEHPFVSALDVFIRSYVNSIESNALKLSEMMTQQHLDTLLQANNKNQLQGISQMLIRAGHYTKLFRGNHGVNYLGYCMKHPVPVDMVKGLWALQSAGLLTNQSCGSLAQYLSEHLQPFELAIAFNALHRLGILSSGWGVYCVTHTRKNSKPVEFVKALYQCRLQQFSTFEINLHCVEALSKTGPDDFQSKIDFIDELKSDAPYLFDVRCRLNISAILNSQADYLSIKAALSALNNTKLLNGEYGQANLDLVFAPAKEPYLMADILIKLCKVGLLTKAKAAQCRHLLEKQSNIEMLRELVILFIVDMKDYPEDFSAQSGKRYENFSALCKHQDLDLVGRLLSPFRDIDQQKHLDIIIHYCDILDRDFVDQAFWRTLHPKNFTGERLLEIGRICEVNQNNRQKAVDEIQHYLKFQQQALKITLISDDQSTHQASVHNSVAQSVLRLSERYGGLIDTRAEYKKQYNKFNSWLNKQHSESVLNKEEVAIRCIKRMSNDGGLTYLEPQSKVSIRTLIIYFWLLIHDDERRTGSEADAKSRLIDALYQIQRGYKLDEKGNDIVSQRGDSPICLDGVFNKLVENMIGLSDCVQIIIVNSVLARMMMRVIIKNKMIALIPVRDEEKNLDEAINETVSANLVCPALWERIKNEVHEEMMKEFSSIQSDLEALYSNVQYLSLGFSPEEQEQYMTEYSAVSFKML